ncbi:MAG TPA: hypothetical protein VHD85_19715 [Terracidiphilus sp.]|jgi:hypothetical protein|nr:hypothetical protein [Terracidiphilus sp.]
MPKNYNDLFKANPLEFMRKYTVTPVNHIGSHGTQIGELNLKGKVKQVDKDSYYYNQMGQNNDLVGYLNFTKVPHDTVNSAQKGHIVVTGSYNPDPTAVQAHYLPWYDNKIISLTIPPMPHNGGGTRYFFTAAINGCSVFIKGTPQNPTIFHAGGKTVKPGSDPKHGAEFWRKMMKTRTETSTGKIMGEVNKTMYVTDRKNKMLGTANSRIFEAWLKQNPNGFRIEDVDPHGCVFGRREGGLWTFYLQENVTIIYTSFVPKNDGTGGFTEKKHMVMRPMQVTEIFPNGQKHVKVTPLLSRPLKA